MSHGSAMPRHLEIRLGGQQAAQALEEQHRQVHKTRRFECHVDRLERVSGPPGRAPQAPITKASRDPHQLHTKPPRSQPTTTRDATPARDSAPSLKMLESPPTQWPYSSPNRYHPVVRPKLRRAPQRLPAPCHFVDQQQPEPSSAERDPGTSKAHTQRACGMFRDHQRSSRRRNCIHG